MGTNHFGNSRIGGLFEPKYDTATFPAYRESHGVGPDSDKRALAELVANPYLAQLVSTIMNDPEIVGPAALTAHARELLRGRFPFCSSDNLSQFTASRPHPDFTISEGGGPLLQWACYVGRGDLEKPDEMYWVTVAHREICENLPITVYDLDPKQGRGWNMLNPETSGRFYPALGVAVMRNVSFLLLDPRYALANLNRLYSSLSTIAPNL